MEVSCGDYHVQVGEDGRVVGCGVDFRRYHVCNVVYGVFACSVNLWNATEGVRVLNVLLVLLDDFAAFQEFSYVSCRFDLSFMRSYLVYRVEEWFYSAVECLQGYRHDLVCQNG